MQDREHFDAILTEGITETSSSRPAPFTPQEEAASWGALMSTQMPGKAG